MRSGNSGSGLGNAVYRTNTARNNNGFRNSSNGGFEIRILVASETEIQMEDSETEILVASGTQTEDLEIQIQAVSVIPCLNHSQDTITEVSDPVIPVDLEIAADLIIPVVVSDPVVHLAAAALEVAHPVVVDSDPVASDNIQLHKNY